MKITTRLLFIAALFALAIPFLFTGIAGAVSYNGDGAYHDATTTGWKLPTATAAFSCPADSTGTYSNRPDCEGLLRFPSFTDQTSCSSAPGFSTGGVQWGSACNDKVTGAPISLKDHDRNALQCDALGGVYVTGACTGKWIAPQPVDISNGTGTGPECLRCHDNTIQYNSVAERWKSSYVKTGHKNMLRKVTAGQPWAGPDGVIYHADSVGSGTTIDWDNATITGTSFTGARQLYYIYGDWMAPAPSAVYDGTSAGTAGYAKYSCASCHTTGYVATNFVAGMEPNKTYSSLNSGITGSWDRDGILCARCHNSSGPTAFTTDAYRAGLAWGSYLGFSTHDSNPSSAQRTSLCIECHNSTNSKADPAGRLSTNATGNGFSGHILGNQFLNSTHGRFTGTSLQVGTAANYDSAFSDGDACSIVKAGVTTGTRVYEVKTEEECAAEVAVYNADSYIWTPGTAQGTCTTCHDVHQSIVPEVGAAEPLKRECMTCHTSKSSAGMNHPTGGETPAGLAGAVPSVACEVCHMATESVEGSTHLPVHLWRINTSNSYTTFPTATEWSAGTKIAHTAPDGTYTNAVWVDLDLACGQCHGGSGAAKTGIPKFGKPKLSVLATNIHNTIPRTASFTWAIGTANNQVVFDASASTCASAPCTYVWNFGNGTTGTGVAPSKTYEKAGNFLVIVTVTDSTGAQTMSPIRQVTAVSSNTPPTAIRTFAVSGMTVTVTDASTDAQDATGALAVTVQCGNNTKKTGAGGTALVCTYTTPGSYIIRHSVKDTGGLGDASANIVATVTNTATTYKVSGVVTKADGTTPFPYVTLNLQQGGVNKYVAVSKATTGAFTFTGVLPGTYNVRAVKAGATFASPAVTGVVVSADVTGVTVTATAP